MRVPTETSPIEPSRSVESGPPRIGSCLGSASAIQDAGLSLLASFVLERDSEPNAKIQDGAVLDRQVLSDDLGDT